MVYFFSHISNFSKSESISNFSKFGSISNFSYPQSSSEFPIFFQDSLLSVHILFLIVPSMKVSQIFLILTVKLGFKIFSGPNFFSPSLSLSHNFFGIPKSLESPRSEQIAKLPIAPLSLSLYSCS